jgi:hypothetical protein
MIQIGINIAVKGTDAGLPPAPVNSSPPVISGTTTLGSVLTTTDGTWTNSPSSFSYQWKRGATNIGTNSNTYTLVVADSGAAITCEVTATNAGGSSAPAASNIITAQTYSSPNCTILPVISGNTTIVGSILTTTDGTWTGNPTPTYTYQWKRGATNIGTNSPNYTSVFADANTSITCEVTATNALGSAGGSSNTLIMGTFWPANTVAPVISGTAVVGNVLTTTNGTWTNSPSSFAYQWRRGGVPISGATSINYTLVQADAGFNINVSVVATNVLGNGIGYSSNLFTYDLDAQNFITTAVITNSTEKSAINTLVIGLKSDSLWTSMLAIYPFVGGTATSCKYNLKNTATFELLFVGTWLPASFTSFGIQPNGTDTYANTNFTPSTSWLTLGNSSISAYSRTNNSNAGTLWGTRSAANGNTSLYPILRNAAITNVLHNSNSTQAPSPLPTTSAINLMTSRIDTANLIIALNGVASSYVKAEVILSAFPIFLSAKNSSNAVEALSYSNRQLAFAHIGTGLTTGQCTQLYTRIQAFQTTLGRNV